MTPGELPRGTMAVLAHRQLASATGDEMVTWAVDALEDGFDSHALRRLAALDLDGIPSVFDAAPLFASAVEELALTVPHDKDGILRAYLLVLARRVLDGACAVEDGLKTIHRDVLEPLNHPADLMDWCYLWEGLEPGTFESLDDEAVAVQARELARRTVA